MISNSILGISMLSIALSTNPITVSTNTEGIVTTSSLNVRSGPGTNYSVSFKISKNNKVRILETKQGWYKIYINGKEGWVSGTYIKIQTNSNTQPDNNSSSNITKTTTANVNIRKGPGTNYGILSSILKGKTVTVISSSNGWDRVSYNGITGYVSNQYLKTASTSSGGNSNSGNISKPENTVKYKVTSSTLNIRSGPSTNNSILGKLNKNNVIEVISITNGWAKIIYGNTYGYCSNSYLQKIVTSSSSNNNVQFKYELEDNKDTFIITTTQKVSYKTSYLPNPSRFIIDLDNVKLNRNILDQYVNGKYINVYRASYDKQTNTTRLVLEFSDEFDRNKIQIIQNDNILKVVFNEKSTQPSEPSVPVNNVEFKYELGDNKDTFIITTTEKTSYKTSYLPNPSKLIIDLDNTKLNNSILNQYLNSKYIKVYRASYNKETNTTKLVIEFSDEFDRDKIQIIQDDNILKVVFEEDELPPEMEGPIQPDEPVVPNNNAEFKYELEDNKDTFIITSTTKTEYETSYLSDISTLVIKLKNTKIANESLEETLNQKYIKGYSAIYDEDTNITRVEIKFVTDFNKDKVQINQIDNIIKVTYNEDVSLPEIEEPIEPENPSISINNLNFNYELKESKDTFVIASTNKASYNSFYLSGITSTTTRLVIDFENAKIDTNISGINLDKTYIKTYRAHYHENENRTRLVIEFSSSFNKNNIKIYQDGNIMRIVFDKEIGINKPSISDPSWKITYINREFQEYIKSQSNRNAVISSNGGFVKATVDEIYKHANPDESLLDDRNYKFQFLRLDEYRDVEIEKLNNYLNQLSVSSGKKNIFENKGQAFIDACKKYNLDPIYFLSHTLLETGNGTSALAQGYEVELDENGNAKMYHYKDKNGNLVYENNKPVMYVKLKDSNTPANTPTVTVYNLFGIGAIDVASKEGGTTKAYNEGWFTVEKAIEGGAKWISRNYINSTTYTHQNTLYSMRWDYVKDWHQYSTDVGWALKISKFINTLSYIYLNGNDDLSYIFPKYK